MRIRKNTASWDRSFGHGPSDFYVDVPDGVAQAAKQRLLLWYHSWFLDLTAGVPYLTKVLGKYTGQTRDPVMQAAILGTEGVNSLIAYSSEVNPDTRAFSVNATVDTIYGNFTFGAQVPPFG